MLYVRVCAQMYVRVFLRVFGWMDGFWLLQLWEMRGRVFFLFILFALFYFVVFYRCKALCVAVV